MPVQQTSVAVYLMPYFAKAARSLGTDSRPLIPLQKALRFLDARLVTGEEYYSAQADKARAVPRASLADRFVLAVLEDIWRGRARQYREGTLQENFVLVAPSHRAQLLVALANDEKFDRFIFSAVPQGARPLEERLEDIAAHPEAGSLSRLRMLMR